jgi:hypothetical protein
MPSGEPSFHAFNPVEKPVCQTHSQTALSAPVCSVTGDSASSALSTSAPKSLLPKQSRNTEKVRRHNVGEGGATLSAEVEVSYIVEVHDQAGDWDVAAAAAARTVPVVDNVGDGGATSLAVKEASYTPESLSKTRGSDNSSSDSSSTSSSSEELSNDDASNGSTKSGSVVDASTDVPVVGASNPAVISTTEAIVAVVAAMSTATLSSTKSLYRTLGNEVHAKEPGWIPASLV